MKTQINAALQYYSELIKFTEDMKHIQRNLTYFNAMPIGDMLKLESPSLGILDEVTESLNDNNLDPKQVFKLLEATKFGAISFQLAFTFGGDGFGLPLKTICSLCNPEATRLLFDSYEGRNYMDDNMPFEVEEILMTETDGDRMFERISLMLSAQLAVQNLPGISLPLYLN